tara:strand:- start:8 stop:115 length:108 start_codon:yes stop_codon:yes gene_type:complete
MPNNQLGMIFLLKEQSKKIAEDNKILNFEFKIEKE